MKTICFFSGDITRCGGTERITILLANELAQRDFSVHILSLAESAAEPFFALDSKVKRSVLFSRPLRSVQLSLPVIILREAVFLKKLKPDVLIDIDVFLSAASVPASKLSGCRLIAWEHFHYRENLGCRLRSFARTLAKRFASDIVVLTERDRAQYSVKPSRAEIHCIPNAMTMPDSAAESMPDVPDVPFIFSAGRLIYQKGLERIPRLAEEFFRSHPDWKWLIAGEGILREQIQAEIRQRNLENKVILLGLCNPFPYYGKAKFFVMPSRFEGFVLVLLEALSCGCPAIVFDCPCGPSDVIQNGRNGYLVPAEDFSMMAKRMEDLAEKPFRADPESIGQFSVAEFVQKWERLLQ